MEHLAGLSLSHDHTVVLTPSCDHTVVLICDHTITMFHDHSVALSRDHVVVLTPTRDLNIFQYHLSFELWYTLYQWHLLLNLSKLIKCNA